MSFKKTLPLAILLVITSSPVLAQEEPVVDLGSMPEAITAPDGSPAVPADLVISALRSAMDEPSTEPQSVGLDGSIEPMPLLVNDEPSLDKMSEIVQVGGAFSGAEEPKKEVITSMKSTYKPYEIKVDPGINTIIPIAVDHYNRLVTPFENPFVQTVSDAVIEVHKNVLYIATAESAPITLFVTPDVDDESVSISLTLAPKKIAPVEAHLVMSEVSNTFFSRNAAAKKYEESQPYVDGIMQTMKAIALGDIPQGYQMSSMRAGDAYPTCMQKGIKYNFLDGQYLRGHHHNVAVGVVQNATNVIQEVSEFACLDGNIIAVATWPTPILEPGQKSEIFVISKRVINAPVSRKRESLLDQEVF